MLLVNTTGNFGDSIFISGSGDSFYKISEVRFGGTSGVASEFQVVDENLIQAVVPSFEKLETTGEKYTWANFCFPDYPIVISEARGVSGLASGENNEVFTPIPVVKDFNPKSSFSGEAIYIYGDGFLGATGVKLTGISGDNTAYYTGVGFTGYTGYEEKFCEFSGINNTGIKVTLPSGNTKGLFTVCGTGVSGSSSTFFEPDVLIKAFYTGLDFTQATGADFSGLYFYTCNDFIISGLDFSEELLYYSSGSTHGYPETGYVVDFGLSTSMVKAGEVDFASIKPTTGEIASGLDSAYEGVSGDYVADEYNTVTNKLSDPSREESDYERVRVTGFFQKISNNILSGSVPQNVTLAEVSLIKNQHVFGLSEGTGFYSSKQAKIISNNLGVTALGGQDNKIQIGSVVYKAYNTGLLRITGSGVIQTGYFDNPLSGTGVYSKNLPAFGISTGDNPEAIVAFGENSIVSYSTDEPLIYFSSGARYGRQPLFIEGTDFYSAHFGATGDIKTTNPFLVFVPEFNNLTFEDCFDYYATSGFFPSGCEPQVLFYISGGLSNGTIDTSGNLVSSFYNPQRYLDITSDVFTPKLLKCFLTSQLLNFENSPELLPYSGHVEIQEFCNEYYGRNVTAANQPYSTTAGGISEYTLFESNLREKRKDGGHSRISFNPPPLEISELIEPQKIVAFAHAALAPFSGSGIYFGRPDGSAYPSGQGPTGEFENTSFLTTDSFDGVTTVNRDGRTQKWGISYVNNSFRIFPQPCFRPEGSGFVGLNTDPTGDFIAYNIININCKPSSPVNQRPPFWNNTAPSEYLQKDTKIDKPFSSTSWPNVAVLQSAPAPLFGMPATQKSAQGFMRVSLYPTGRYVEASALDSYENSNFEFAKPKGNPSQPLFTTPNPNASMLPPQTMRIGQDLTLNTPIGTVVGALSAPQNEPKIKILTPQGTGLNEFTEVEINKVETVEPEKGEDNSSSNAPILPSEVTTAYPMNSGPFRSSVNITDRVKMLNQTKFKLDI